MNDGYENDHNNVRCTLSTDTNEQEKASSLGSIPRSSITRTINLPPVVLFLAGGRRLGSGPKTVVKAAREDFDTSDEIVSTASTRSGAQPPAHLVYLAGGRPKDSTHSIKGNEASKSK